MTVNIVKFSRLISYLSQRFGRTLEENSIVDIAAYCNDINDITPASGKVDLSLLFDFIIQKRKIEAIKEHRAITGMGLKESKDEIERLYPVVHPNG